MKTLYFVIALFIYIPANAIASSGVVDEYDCHNDGSSYHCHGDKRLAKKVHTLLGISSKSTAWLYSDGPNNYFVGPSIETELAFDSIALRASWAYQPLISGASGYSLSGWDAGVKIGKGLSRMGKHGFVELGYYSSEFNTADNAATLFSSYQLGVGFIVNKEHWSFDGKILYRNPTPVEDYWNNEANIPTELSQYVFSIGAYRRF